MSDIKVANKAHVEAHVPTGEFVAWLKVQCPDIPEGKITDLSLQYFDGSGTTPEGLRMHFTVDPSGADRA